MIRLFKLALAACLAGQSPTAANFVITIRAPQGNSLQFSKIEVWRSGIPLRNDMMESQYIAPQCVDADSLLNCETADPSQLRITTRVSFDLVTLNNPSGLTDAFVGGSIAVSFVSDDLRIFGGEITLAFISIQSTALGYSWIPFKSDLNKLRSYTSTGEYFYWVDVSNPERPILNNVRLGNLAHRNEIVSICEQLKFRHGAELGVREGVFAHNNLLRWPSNERYYLIDVWAPLLNYKDTANIDIMKQEEILANAKERLHSFSNQTLYLRNLTSEAANIIPDNSLDFIYVDARHDYCGCTQDLEQYWPKLRSGGLMAGHDFITAAEHAAAVPGDDWSLCEDGTVHGGAVKAAVIEFALKHDLFLYVTQEGPWISWLFSLKL